MSSAARDSLSIRGADAAAGAGAPQGDVVNIKLYDPRAATDLVSLVSEVRSLDIESYKMPDNFKTLIKEASLTTKTKDEVIAEFEAKVKTFLLELSKTAAKKKTVQIHIGKYLQVFAIENAKPETEKEKLRTAYIENERLRQELCASMEANFEGSSGIAIDKPVMKKVPKTEDPRELDTLTGAWGGPDTTKSQWSKTRAELVAQIRRAPEGPSLIPVEMVIEQLNVKNKVLMAQKLTVESLEAKIRNMSSVLADALRDRVIELGLDKDAATRDFFSTKDAGKPARISAEILWLTLTAIGKKIQELLTKIKMLEGSEARKNIALHSANKRIKLNASLIKRLIKEIKTQKALTSKIALNNAGRTEEDTSTATSATEIGDLTRQLRAVETALQASNLRINELMRAGKEDADAVKIREAERVQSLVARAEKAEATCDTLQAAAKAKEAEHASALAAAIDAKRDLEDQLAEARKHLSVSDLDSRLGVLYDQIRNLTAMLEASQAAQRNKIQILVPALRGGMVMATVDHGLYAGMATPVRATMAMPTYAEYGAAASPPS